METGKITARTWKRFKLITVASLGIGVLNYLLNEGDSTIPANEYMIDQNPSAFRFLSSHNSTDGNNTTTPTTTPATTPTTTPSTTPSTTPVTSPTTTSSTTPDNSKPYQFEGVYYDNYKRNNYTHGYTESYYDGEEYCNSALLIPGMTLINANVLKIFYLLFLGYLFLGIAIISDIFMEAIEVITSKTKTLEVVDKEGKTYSYDVPVWNATLANLSLMALGSSAPEILLSVIETL